MLLRSFGAMNGCWGTVKECTRRGVATPPTKVGTGAAFGSWGIGMGGWAAIAAAARTSMQNVERTGMPIGSRSRREGGPPGNPAESGEAPSDKDEFRGQRAMTGAEGRLGPDVPRQPALSSVSSSRVGQPAGRPAGHRCRLGPPAGPQSWRMHPPSWPPHARGAQPPAEEPTSQPLTGRPSWSVADTLLHQDDLRQSRMSGRAPGGEAPEPPLTGLT